MWRMLSIMCVPSTIRSWAPDRWVALAVGLEHLQVADGAVLHQLLGVLLVWVGPAVGDGDACPRPRARLHHGVGVRERRREGLLAEHAAGLPPRRRRRSLSRWGPSHRGHTATRSEILLLEHLSVVGHTRRRRPYAPSRPSSPSGSSSATATKIDVGQAHEGYVEPVAPVAPARPADRLPPGTLFIAVSFGLLPQTDRIRGARARRR